MSDFLKLLTSKIQQVEVGTVLSELGKNKYQIRVGGVLVVAQATNDLIIKKGIPAVVTLTEKGWYILGQPKNLSSTGVTEVIISG